MSSSDKNESKLEPPSSHQSRLDGGRNLMTEPMTIAATLLAALISLSHQQPEVLPSRFHINFFSRDPRVLFQSFFISMTTITISIKLQRRFEKQKKSKKRLSSASATNLTQKPNQLQRLQYQFWAVFWLFRIAFWMAGPYMYAAYSSKQTRDGTPLDVKIISQISLTGYAAIAILGPLVGRISQIYGNKVGTLLGMVLYALGTASVASDEVWVLYVGRGVSGIGQSLLNNAPESWFVKESKREELDPKGAYLGETFGTAYAVDSVLAIVAGQLAGFAAHYAGPTGPFLLAPLFLASGSLAALLFWSEHTAAKPSSSPSNVSDKMVQSKPSIRDTLQLMKNDINIALLGLVQACYEGAMYIFVLVWAPTMRETIQKCVGENVATPYGMAFSSFMAACMLGSTIFQRISKKFQLERIAAVLLGTASLSMASSIYTLHQVSSSTDSRRYTMAPVLFLFSSYLLFEATVGVYFPTLGILRSKVLPDSHRSIIMTLYAVPLNALVVTVYLLLDKLGHMGALLVAAMVLLVSMCIILWLDHRIRQKERRKKAREGLKSAISKTRLLVATKNTFLSTLHIDQDRGYDSDSGLPEGPIFGPDGQFDLDSSHRHSASRSMYL